MSNSRDPFWDVVKGIAVILVIVGHSIAYSYGISESKGLLIYKFIYSFHMPLFGLISGYFMYNTVKRHSDKEIILARVRQLLTPIIIFGVTYFLLFRDSSLESKAQIRQLLDIVVGHLWFLWAILFSTVLALFCLKNEKYCPHLISLFIILSLLLPDYFNSAGVKFIFPLFITGYYFNKQQLFGVIKDNIPHCLLSSSLIFAILFCVFRTEMLFYASGYSILSNHLPLTTILFYDIIRFTIGLVGSIMVISALYLIYSAIPLLHHPNAITLIGRNSLWVYVWHFYINDYLGWRLNIIQYIDISKANFCIIYSILLTILSLGLSVLVSNKATIQK